MSSHLYRLYKIVKQSHEKASDLSLVTGFPPAVKTNSNGTNISSSQGLMLYCTCLSEQPRGTPVGETHPCCFALDVAERILKCNENHTQNTKVQCISLEIV